MFTLMPLYALKMDKLRIFLSQDSYEKGNRVTNDSEVN